MKNEIEVFQNPDFGEIRTLTVNGEPWFVGKDVAERLGYSNPSKAVISHVDDEDKRFEMMSISDSQNGNLVKTAIINESGLYSLILSSKLPKAKAFKRWITSEVIPAIRKTGGYRTNTENLFRCAQIMASCRPENLPQVMNILGQIVPGIGVENPACEAPPLPQAEHLPSIRKHTRCEAKFNLKALNAILAERDITDSMLARMIGCSDGVVSKWRRGIMQPCAENRERLCNVLGVPQGHFDMQKRRKRPQGGRTNA